MSFPLRDAAADSFILSAAAAAAAAACFLSTQHDSETWLPIESIATEAQSIHCEAQINFTRSSRRAALVEINKVLLK